MQPEVPFLDGKVAEHGVESFQQVSVEPVIPVKGL